MLEQSYKKTVTETGDSFIIDDDECPLKLDWMTLKG